MGGAQEHASPWAPSRLVRPVRHPRIPFPRFRCLHFLQTAVSAGFPRSQNHNYPSQRFQTRRHAARLCRAAIDLIKPRLELPPLEAEPCRWSMHVAPEQVRPAGCPSAPRHSSELSEARLSRVRRPGRLPTRVASPGRSRDVQTTTVSTEHRAVGRLVKNLDRPSLLASSLLVHRDHGVSPADRSGRASTRRSSIGAVSALLAGRMAHKPCLWFLRKLPIRHRPSRCFGPGCPSPKLRSERCVFVRRALPNGRNNRRSCLCHGQEVFMHSPCRTRASSTPESGVAPFFWQLRVRNRRGPCKGSSSPFRQTADLRREPRSLRSLQRPCFVPAFTSPGRLPPEELQSETRTSSAKRFTQLARSTVGTRR
jgi:hypothetical protein